MAKLARTVTPGVAHHVTQHGNRCQPTFFSEDDYRAYPDLLALRKRARTVRPGAG